MKAPAGSEVDDDIRARAARVRLAAFDVDGVLTDGRLYYAADGTESKAFHTHDGLGLKTLREHGIEVALVTARESAVVVARARELGVRHVYQGQRDKIECLTHLCKALNIGFDAVAYCGDDLPDLAAIQRVGLGIAVASAHPVILESARWRTRLPGGAGAVREVCDLLLAAHGKSEAVLQRYLAPG